MKGLLALCGLLILPAFATDPQHLLSPVPVTIHTTKFASAYTAYEIVAKLLGVRIQLGAELKNIHATLDLKNVTAAEALDAIRQIAHQQWEAGAGGSTVLMIVTPNQ